MSNLILFDPLEIRETLLPLSFTRPVAKIRVGILSIDEKWKKRINTSVSFLTQDYLSEKYKLSVTNDNLFINGALCPNEALLKAITTLEKESCLKKDGLLLAVKTSSNSIEDTSQWNTIEFNEECNLIDEIWKIFQLNAQEIKYDFDLITQGRTSQPLSDPHTIVYGKENLFIEEGATIKAAVINAENGPVYIGKNTYIHEGAIIKGAFALCENSHVNIGAKIRGDTTIGPHSKIGGEVSNSVIFGNSNKGHEGFLGNSVLGEWCNIGADTNTSNLKNNYADVKIWNYTKGGFKTTKQMFCGLIMGDHSKCGINTMFNTGTVVGVSANIFGPGFPRNFVPSFSWGGAAGFTTFQLRKVYEVTEKVMERKNIDFDTVEKNILDKVF
ncbi:MAG: GlmU family protein, partial [Cyclobacteriaceae bacterium]|nr:GlmU family protein [Cyclobacteriaceae bacterium]